METWLCVCALHVKALASTALRPNAPVPLAVWCTA